MSESEDCDDLPPISVNVSARDSSTFSMPPAGVLAGQRAREADTERELSQLRLAHSDSSGSDGDALAALRADDDEEGPARSAPDPSADRLLAALGLQHLDPPVAPRDERECVAAGAALAAALLRPRPRGSALGVARALHALLDESPAAHSAALARALAHAPAAALSRAARLRLADWLRAGGDGARALARRLARSALADLARADADADLEDDALEAAAGAAWRRLDDAGRLELLQLAPRALAPSAGLLRAPAQPQPPAPAAHRLHRLKVEVAAAKLRLLFRSTAGS